MKIPKSLCANAQSLSKWKMFSHHVTRIFLVGIFLGWNISPGPFSRHSGNLSWGGSEEALLTKENNLCSQAFIQVMTSKDFYKTGQPICHTFKSNLFFLMKDSYAYFITTDFSPCHKRSNTTVQPLNWKMSRHLLDFHNIRYPLYLSFLDNPKVTSKVTDSVACHTTTHDLVSLEIREETVLLFSTEVRLNWRYS